MSDDVNATLWQRVKDLESTLKCLRSDNDAAQLKLKLMREELARAFNREDASRHAASGLPTELVYALRNAAPDGRQGVWVPLPGHQRLYALVDGAGVDADLVGEVTIWEWLQAHAAAPPVEFSIVELPARLHGVAWEGGPMMISSSMSGRERIAALRQLRRAAQRPRSRSRRLYGVGLAALPATLLWRLAKHLTFSSTATVPAALTVVTALPLATAAAISPASPSGSAVLTLDGPDGSPRTVRIQPVDHPIGWPAVSPGQPRDTPRPSPPTGSDTDSATTAPYRLTPPGRPAPAPPSTPPVPPVQLPPQPPTPVPEPSASPPTVQLPPVELPPVELPPVNLPSVPVTPTPEPSVSETPGEAPNEPPPLPSPTASQAPAEPEPSSTEPAAEPTPPKSPSEPGNAPSLDPTAEPSSGSSSPSAEPPDLPLTTPEH